VAGSTCVFSNNWYSQVCLWFSSEARAAGARWGGLGRDGANDV
jgi:hypothetical protein